MAGHNGLGGGGHAHRVAAQDAGGPHLGGGLVLGAVAVEVHALPQGDGQLRRRPPGHVLEPGGIQVGGVGEAHAELRDVCPAQGGFGEQLDLVGDEHQVPRLPVGAHTPGGVGDDQRVAAQQAQHPHGVGNLVIAVALVVVHPPLHDGHIPARQGAEHQLPLVPGSGGRLEVGNPAIGDGDGVFHHVA